MRGFQVSPPCRSEPVPQPGGQPEKLGFSTIKNSQDRICYSCPRDQSHQKAEISRKAAAHPCNSQHTVRSRELVEPTAASLLPGQGWSMAAPPPPWAALLTPSVSFFPTL